MASLWQQAGRAGRREQPSTSIYIAFDGPLDQYFMKQPDKLFGRAIERAQVSCLVFVWILIQRFYSINVKLETENEKQLTKLCSFGLTTSLETSR